jgi:hypothetical protein
MKASRWGDVRFSISINESVSVDMIKINPPGDTRD